MKDTILQNSSLSSLDRGRGRCIVISEETSKRITALRFLLIVFVVFIHNNLTDLDFKNTPDVFNQSLFGKWLQLLISDGIARAAVPLFFLFAAFLQASKNDPYSILLKKKAKSLLLPYFLWMAIYFILNEGAGLKLIVLQIYPSILKNPDSTCLDWGAAKWLQKIFGYSFKDGALFHPGFAYHLWFVRDLIILTVISPLLNFIIKRKSFLFLVLLSFLYFSGINIFFLSVDALVFYTLGLYSAEYDFDFFKCSDKIKWIDCLLLFLLSFFLFHAVFSENKYFGNFMILAACIMLLKFSLLIIESEKYFKIAEYLAGFSFWLYAVHTPFLNKMIRKIWLKLLPLENGFFCLAEYFGVSILTIAIALPLGIFIKKYFPKIFALLVGKKL